MASFRRRFGLCAVNEPALKLIGEPCLNAFRGLFRPCRPDRRPAVVDRIGVDNRFAVDFATFRTMEKAR
jgi:hypothetical protein